MSEDKVVETFVNFSTSMIDEKGIYPFPMVTATKEGLLEVCALAAPPGEAITTCLKKIIKREVVAAMIGLDRTTKPGQGTEFADVLTCLLWLEGKKDWSGREWREWIKIGVINYQNEPRIVRPIDWGNEFWNRMMRKEVDGFRIMRTSTGEEL